MRLSFIGMGYVGLCTAVCLADKGHQVMGVDVDAEKVNAINAGKPQIFEPGLEDLLSTSLKKNLLYCTTSTKDAVLKSDITFITVGTPSLPDGSVDLTFIKASAKDIGEVLRRKPDYHLIVVRSTVTPGTTERVVKPTLEERSGKKCGKDFGLCVCPEFLREGNAIYDTLHPDRVIIGEHDRRSGDMLESLFRDLYGNGVPMIRTNLPTAEMIKYANNAFLAMKVSLINTIANICEQTPGVDVTVVAKAIGLDPRIGPLFLNAGLGWGGSCFLKDIKALMAYSKSIGYTPRLVEEVVAVNEAQPVRTIERVKERLGDLKGKRIAVLGLAFKPNTDDMREASSIKVINALLREGAEAIAYDSVAKDNAVKIFGDKIRYANSSVDCLKGADCCIIVTEWDEFKQLTPEDFLKHMRRPFVVDGRRVFDPSKFRDRLEYIAVGLGAP